MILIKEPLEFEWDEGNQDKNWSKHSVTMAEAEQVFFDQQRKMSRDVGHSRREPRFVLIGKTKTGRILFITFTLRKTKIRVISARDLNPRKERRLYEKTLDLT